MSKRIVGFLSVFVVLACCQVFGSPFQSQAGGQQEGQKMQDNKQPTSAPGATSATQLDPAKRPNRRPRPIA